MRAWPSLSGGGGSEETGSVLHGALMKRQYPGSFVVIAGEGAAFLGAGGRAAGMVSVLFAVDPLEEDIEKEVATKDANRQKNCEGHDGLTWADVNAQPGQGKE
jgi:hypothetical protein